MKEHQSIQGKLRLRLVDRFGRTLDEQQVFNRITLAGKIMVAQLFTGASTPLIQYFGIGTGNAQNEAETYALNREVKILKTQFRKALSGSPVITEEEGRIKVRFTGELDFSEPVGSIPIDITEAGLFNDKRADRGGIINPPISGGGGVEIPDPEEGSTSNPGGDGRSPIAELPVGKVPKTRSAPLPTNIPTDMYNRVVFLPITKTADFKLQLFWEIIF